MKTYVFGSIVVASLALVGCASKKKDLTAGATPPAASTTSDSAAGYPEGQVGSAAAPGSQTDMIAQVGSDRVLFDYDSYTLSDEARSVLQRQVQWLQDNPNATLTIEGHCDERGTRDYNLALGERRATAVSNYLTSLGISPSRLRTISYGKERPEAMGSDEEGYAQNRRAVSMVAGAIG